MLPPSLLIGAGEGGTEILETAVRHDPELSTAASVRLLAVPAPSGPEARYLNHRIPRVDAHSASAAAVQKAHDLLHLDSPIAVGYTLRVVAAARADDSPAIFAILACMHAISKDDRVRAVAKTLRLYCVLLCEDSEKALAQLCSLEPPLPTWCLLGQDMGPGLVTLQELHEPAACLVSLLREERSEIHGLEASPGKLYRVATWTLEHGSRHLLRERHRTAAIGLLERALGTPVSSDLHDDDSILSMARAWADREGSIMNVDDHALGHLADGFSALAALTETYGEALCREMLPVFGAPAPTTLGADWSQQVAYRIDSELAPQLARTRGSASAEVRRATEEVERRAAKRLEELHSLAADGTPAGLEPLIEQVGSLGEALNSARRQLPNPLRARPPEDALPRLESARQAALRDLERLPPPQVLRGWLLGAVLLVGVLTTPVLLFLGELLGPPDPGAAWLTRAVHIGLQTLLSPPWAAISALLGAAISYALSVRILRRWLARRAWVHLDPAWGRLASAVHFAVSQALSVASDQLERDGARAVSTILDSHGRRIEDYRRRLEYGRNCISWLARTLRQEGGPGFEPSPTAWRLVRLSTSPFRWILLPPASDEARQVPSASVSSLWASQFRPDQPDGAHALLWPDRFLLWLESQLDEPLGPNGVPEGTGPETADLRKALSMSYSSPDWVETRRAILGGRIKEALRHASLLDEVADRYRLRSAEERSDRLYLLRISSKR